MRKMSEDSQYKEIIANGVGAIYYHFYPKENPHDIYTFVKYKCRTDKGLLGMVEMARKLVGRTANKNLHTLFVKIEISKELYFADKGKRRK